MKCHGRNLTLALWATSAMWVGCSNGAPEAPPMQFERWAYARLVPEADIGTSTVGWHVLEPGVGQILSIGHSWTEGGSLVTKLQPGSAELLLHLPAGEPRVGMQWKVGDRPGCLRIHRGQPAPTFESCSLQGAIKVLELTPTHAVYELSVSADGMPPPKLQGTVRAKRCAAFRCPP